MCHLPLVLGEGRHDFLRRTFPHAYRTIDERMEISTRETTLIFSSKGSIS